jgi:colicin import membrane protein
VSSRISKRSGVPEWDDAVLRAIERTEVLPRDENGKVPPAMTIVYRPRD